eukprot:3678146-Rhodomonas_salina.1
MMAACTRQPQGHHISRLRASQSHLTPVPLQAQVGVTVGCTEAEAELTGSGMPPLASPSQRA